MPSTVDICNLALSHLGDSASVASIDPPEGSAQAEHCARFYPVALSALLEMHPWGFATCRATLAEVANPSSTWQYAYALPSDAVNLISVLDPNAQDDYSASAPTDPTTYGNAGRNVIGGAYTPQNFSPEIDANGNDIILTNQAGAVLRYTRLVSDTTKFSPLFVEALSWLLASKLAGPVLKGDAGRKAAQDCLKMMGYWLGRATDSDSSQRRVSAQQNVTWVNGR